MAYTKTRKGVTLTFETRRQIREARSARDRRLWLKYEREFKQLETRIENGYYHRQVEMGLIKEDYGNAQED